MVDHDLIPVAGRLGARSNADYALRLLDNPKGRAMSRFKNEVVHLQAHIKTLRIGTVALLVLALVMGGGWWSAPRDLTIHMPPDLRSGRSEEHTSELQSLMRISYAVFCLKKKTQET